MNHTTSRRRLLTLAAGTAGAGVLAPLAPALAENQLNSAPMSSTSGVVFKADFARYGFRQYLTFQPRWGVQDQDLGVMDDPTGHDRKVAWFDSRRRHHIGTPYPRSAISTPLIVNRGDERWVRAHVYISSKGNPLRKHNDWIALMSGAYGAPYGGSSPLGVSVVHGANGKNVLNFGNTFRYLKEEVEFPLDKWVGIALHYKLDYKGWAELYLDRGKGLTQLSLAGKKRVTMDTLRRGCNDRGRNDVRIGMYGNNPARMYVAEHVVATSKAAVGGRFAH